MVSMYAAHILLVFLQISIHEKIKGLIMVDWQKSKSLRTITTETLMKELSGNIRTEMKQNISSLMILFKMPHLIEFYYTIK